MKLFIIGCFVVVGFSACLKDTPYADYSQTQPIIEFGLSAASGNSSDNTSIYGNYYAYAGDTANYAGPAVMDTAVAIVVASPQVLSSDVTATVKVDASQIAPFNNYLGSTYEVLPDSLYQLTTTGTVTAGYRIGRIPIVLNMGKFSSSHHYALPLVITGATTKTGQNLVVSGNSSLFIWTFDR